MREHKTPPEDRRERAEDSAPRPSAPHAALLELQRQAGNRAVGALLARDTAVEADAEQEAPRAGATLELGDFGTFELLSMQVKMTPGRESTGGDLYVTVPQDERAAKLLQASAAGKVIPEVLFGPPPMRMREVLIANVTFSGTPGGEHAPVVSLTLNFGSIEHIKPED